MPVCVAPPLVSVNRRPMDDIAKRQPSSLTAYLALVRPPNVATALADVLAGYGVAGLGNTAALSWLLVSTACLYGGGVALNDFFDRHLDQIERPERPIPSGRVPAAIAGSIGGLLLVSGIAAASRASLAAGTIALAIAGLALLYDAAAKHGRVTGPVTIAGCRGLNLLLGVAAVPSMVAMAWPIAILPFAHIVGVTALSRGEVLGGTRAVATFSLSMVTTVVAALFVMSLRTSHSVAAGIALTLLLGWRVLPPFWRARQRCASRDIRAAVRAGVLSLVLLDAAIGAVYAGAPYGLVILAVAPVAWLLARPFAVT
jgi:4-hydroxybenzoate polyprenyltransferase